MCAHASAKEEHDKFIWTKHTKTSQPQCTEVPNKYPLIIYTRTHDTVCMHTHKISAIEEHYKFIYNKHITVQY